MQTLPRHFNSFHRFQLKSVKYIVSALNEAYQMLNEQPIEIGVLATVNQPM